MTDDPSGGEEDRPAAADRLRERAREREHEDGDGEENEEQPSHAHTTPAGPHLFP